MLSAECVSACASRAERLLACFESGACILIQFLVSRAVRVSACAERVSSACASFVSRFLELSVYLVCRLHVPRELSVSWHVSRAERVSSFSSLCQELCVCLHVLGVCCLPVPRLLAGFES